MFEFKNKTILIISPNYWGKMMVSKHHYAIELAQKGNLVFYLNPPNLKKKYFELNQIEDNLYLIDYKPIFRGQRFLPAFIFNFFLIIQVKFIQKKIKKSIDIIWSFDNFLFINLSIFKAKYKLLFIADNGEINAIKIAAKSTDIVFSVSMIMLSGLDAFTEKLHFINHGLIREFSDTAQKRIIELSNYTSKNHKINVCYIGNLFIKSLDRKICKVLITENKHVNFSFYGATTLQECNLGGYSSAETLEFIDFLRNQENVFLRGPVTSNVLVNEIYKFDAFIVLINPQNDYNKGSNSHKTLEYLSTGKVIIANHMSTYKDKADLIEMVDEDHNDNFPALFKKVISNLEYYNNIELQRKRIEFALDNTYEKQIIRIEKYIKEL